MQYIYAYLLFCLLVGVTIPTSASAVKGKREVDTTRDSSLSHCRWRNKDNDKWNHLDQTEGHRYYGDDDDHHNWHKYHDNDNDDNNCSEDGVYEYSEDDPRAIYGARRVTAQMGVAGAVLILLGVYLMIFGYRCFRPTLAVSGFLTFGLITWIGLTNSQSARGFSNDAVTMVAVPAGLGILGAVLYASCLWNVSIYLVGGMGGLAFGLFILCWREDLVIHEDVARACFLVALAVFFAALTFFFVRYVMLFSSSFVGAYIFIVGIDFIAHTGYIGGIKSILDRNELHHVKYVIDQRVYGIMSVIIVLFLASFGWQYYYNRERTFGISFAEAKKGAEEGE